MLDFRHCGLECVGPQMDARSRGKMAHLFRPLNRSSNAQAFNFYW